MIADPRETLYLQLKGFVGETYFYDSYYLNNIGGIGEKDEN